MDKANSVALYSQPRVDQDPVAIQMGPTVNLPDTSKLDIKDLGGVDQLAVYPPEIVNLASNIRSGADFKLRDYKMARDLASAKIGTPDLGIMVGAGPQVSADPFIQMQMKEDSLIDPIRRSTTDRRLAFDRLTTGEEVALYPEFHDYRDNNEYYAQRQTTGEKWANGMKKLVGKVGVGILGNIGGSLYGLGEAVLTQSLEATYDNSVMDYLDDLNTKMDRKLPNYYTKAEQDLGLGARLGTANFWADKFAGGSVFTISAIASEAILSAVSGGASLPTAGARVGGRLMAGVNRGTRALAKEASSLNLGKSMLNINNANKIGAIRSGANIGHAVGKFGQSARYVYTTSAYESGFETRMFKKEATDEFYSLFELNNKRLPNNEEVAEFNSRLDEASRFVYGANMLIVGSSNIYGPMASLLGRKPKPKFSNSWVSNNIFGAGFKADSKGMVRAVVPKTWQKALRYPYLAVSSALPEGAEEGGQGIASEGATKWALAPFSKDNNDAIKGILEVTLDNAGDYLRSVEGQEEILIGALMGMGMGAGGSIRSGSGLQGQYSQFDRYSKNLETYSDVYLSKDFSKMLLFANRNMNAIKEAEEAQERGDHKGVDRAIDSAILSQLTFARSNQYYDQTVKQAINQMKLVSTEEIMQAHGLEEGQEAIAEEIRATQIEHYKDIAQRFERNANFVDKYFGDKLTPQEQEEFGDDGGISKMKDLVTYTLTIGEDSYSKSKEAFNELIEELSGVTGNTNALNIMSVLDTVNEEDSKAVLNIKEEIEKTNSELQKLEQEREEKVAQGKKVDVEAEIEKTAKMEDNSGRILQLQDKLTSLEAELNTRIEIAKAKNPFLDSTELGYVTVEDLLNLDKVLEVLSDTLKNNQGIEDSRANRLSILLDDYNYYVKTFQESSKMVDLMRSKKLEITGKKGLLSKYGKSEITDHTKDFLDSVKNVSKESFAGVDVATNAGMLMDIINQYRKSGEIKVAEFIPSKVSNDPVTNLKDTIKKIIGESNYLKLRSKDMSDTLPFVTDEEVLEYLDKFLAGEVIPSSVEDVFAMTFFDGSKENRLEQLRIMNTLLQQEVGDTTDNSQGLNAEGFQKLIVDTVNKFYTTNGYQLTYRDPRLLQTYDNAFMRVKKGDNTRIHISNITPQGLLEALQYEGMVELLTEEGLTEVEVGDINNYRNQVGSMFTVQMGETAVTFEMGENGGIDMKVEDFNSLLEQSELEVFKNGLTTSGSYTMMYNKGLPLESDFNSQEEISYTSKDIYNMKRGDKVRLVIPLNDAYNQDLLSKLDNGELSKAEVTARIRIQVLDSSGNLVADLKSSENVGDVNMDEFQHIRSSAFDLVESTTELEGKLDIGVELSVEEIFLGLPRFNIVGGEVQMHDIDMDHVIDFGFATRGKAGKGKSALTLKNGTKDVRTDLVDKLGKKEMPVVVVRLEGQVIAVPVAMETKESTISDDIVSRLWNSTTDSEVRDIVNEVNATLIKYGLEPKAYNLYYITEKNNTIIDEKGEFTKNFSDALSMLRERDQYHPYKDWLEEGFDSTNLPLQAKTGLELGTQFMTSPKIMINFNNVEPKMTPSKKVSDTQTRQKVDKVKAIQKMTDLLQESWRLHTGIESLRSSIELEKEASLKEFDIREGYQVVNLGNDRGDVIIYKKGKSVYLFEQGDGPTLELLYLEELQKREKLTKDELQATKEAVKSVLEAHSDKLVKGPLKYEGQNWVDSREGEIQDKLTKLKSKLTQLNKILEDSKLSEDPSLKPIIGDKILIEEYVFEAISNNRKC